MTRRIEPRPPVAPPQSEVENSQEKRKKEKETRKTQSQTTQSGRKEKCRERAVTRVHATHCNADRRSVRTVGRRNGAVLGE